MTVCDYDYEMAQAAHDMQASLETDIATLVDERDEARAQLVAANDNEADAVLRAQELERERDEALAWNRTERDALREELAAVRKEAERYEIACADYGAELDAIRDACDEAGIEHSGRTQAERVRELADGYRDARRRNVKYVKQRNEARKRYEALERGVLKLRSKLSKDGEYRVCRKDGESLDEYEKYTFGELYMELDEVLFGKEFVEVDA